MNIDTLQKIAEAATPGPRVLEMSEGQFARSAIVRVSGWGIVAVVGLAPDLPHWDGPQRANAHLIAACEPQTVLRLIAVARAAKADVADADARCAAKRRGDHGESEKRYCEAYTGRGRAHCLDCPADDVSDEVRSALAELDRQQEPTNG